ncbi:Alstrom syndrome protein 1 [Holothuria leucospilota]|uniref:Alstrom syndrome protein 1 n=1 Tax=Holothuria leucospilota TaxID=206669 RepID=A0A9Q1BH63_HOLLE|nr:Alstrom syndrome protein 1 [Holothuria leucospilota]
MFAMAAQDSPRRSRTPKKRSWYALVPEHVELSPSRSCSPASRRSSESSRSASPAPSLTKSHGLLEYSSPSQSASLEEGPLDQTKENGKQASLVLESKSEEMRPSASLVSEYFDAKQSLSAVDVTGGITRESFPLVEGEITQESSVSLEMTTEPSGSETSQVQGEHEVKMDRLAEVRETVEEKVAEASSVPIVDSNVHEVEDAKSFSKVDTERTDMGSKDNSVTLSQHSFNVSEAADDTVGNKRLEVEEASKDEDELLKHEQVMEQDVPTSQPSGVTSDENVEAHGSLDEKYLRVSDQMDPQVSADGSERQEDEFLDEVELKHPTLLDTSASKQEDMLDGQVVSGPPHVPISHSESHEDSHTDQERSSSSQDSQNITKSGSLSGDSLPDEGRMRGSQVQLPLDLNSLQPLSQSPPAASRSGVVLSQSVEVARQINQHSEADASSEEVKVSSSSSAPLQSTSSYIKYPPELQSRPVSHESALHQADSGRESVGDSRLIRPSDLYGSPRGQDLEDSLARKVAQLLIESGQITFKPKEKQHDASKVSTRSSSCSGSPDSIEGSITPSSQKDFPDGRDTFSRRDSLNNKERSGRESPESSVSSCTDSLALHVQQLLRESEHLRTKIPGREVGHGVSSGRRDSANTSDMSTSSSVKRIIRKVNANLPGSDSDYDVGAGQRPEGQGKGTETNAEFGRESPRIVNVHGAEYRGSTQSSPRSYGSHGKNSPYHSDSGRESPRYQGEVNRGSPSQVRSTKISRPLSQVSQERGRPSEGSFSSSHTRDSLSQRVQNILASTEYVEGVIPRYQSQEGETFYPLETGPQHYSPSRTKSHGTVNGHQERSPLYQKQDPVSDRHRFQGSEDAESVARRVQAILMEEAPQERVDRILQEAGIPYSEDSPYTSPLESEQESRAASYHTAASVPGGSHADGIENFGALEKARAVLENQLQRVSERTFDHSIVWETPGKHRRGTEDVQEKGPPVRPVEAWADFRAPARSDQQYSPAPVESPQHTFADPQVVSYPHSESIPRADEEYYSLPPSTTVIRRDQRSSYDSQEATGARPRSYPQADASRGPSYHRSYSTPDGQSGIPRRTIPTPSAIPRMSHGRSSSLGKATDFVSQRPSSQEYPHEPELYSLPSQRPMSATFPRSHDRSRRITFGSSVHSVSGSSPPSSSRVSRGTSPDGNILHPYRPPGSAETMYTYQVDQGGRDAYSSTINSSTTMESTHTGSDDAQPPAFPAHVLGSRKDPPRGDGSFIPRMSPRDYSTAPGEARGHIVKGSKLPTMRRESSPDPSAVIGRDITGTKPLDIPLDLSRPRRERLEDPRLSSSAPGRASPSMKPDYPQGQAFPDEPHGVERDVHYGRLPSQDPRLERTSAFAYTGNRGSTGQEVYGRGRRSEVPGSYSREVLTDVLQDEDDKLAQADDMWRQYQQLKGHQHQDGKEVEGISGASSIDESRIKRLASLVRDPVGHTARNIAQEVGLEEDRKADRRREVDPKENQVTDLLKSDHGTREKGGIVTQLDDGLDSVHTEQISRKAQTSFVVDFPTENESRGKEVQPAKKQKTSKMIPPTGIPQRDMRPKKKIIPKAVTPTKRKAITQEVYEASPDVTEPSPEAVLSDLSLDSEQLLLLLGSHGIKKLSSKLLNLQQRIEKQKEHHRKQYGGQKSRKPKHTVGKKKTIPRPAHASTPAEPPDAELVKEVAEIVRGKVEEEDRTTSTVSSLTVASRQISEPDSVPESSSESTLIDTRHISKTERKPQVRQLPKDDSEVEYRTSEAESDVSVLCSCRPVLRRPRSAQERGRSEPETGIPQRIDLGGVFKRPNGVAPRTSSRIPVKDYGGRLPDGDNRNHVSPTPTKKIPRGTAFTIDLSQEDQTSRSRHDKDVTEEKGVLTDVPEKSRDERRALVEKRGALKMVNKENVTPKPSKLTPPGIAWFQPLSKKMPWQEERPRPKPMIISALQEDPKTGKLSLQDAFLRHRPDFISQCRERQRKMKLAAEERHIQASMELERVRLFEEQKAKKANPLAHPYSDQLHKPAKRNLSRREMKQQTQKIYSRLPEVVRKKEENKKEIINQTNRLRAQIYRKKLSDRLKAGWPNQ